MRHPSILFVLFLGISFLSTLIYAEVPEHNPDLDSNCPPGFQWSRGTVSCKQADCPDGAGRTYTYDCNCGEAWDRPFRTCYENGLAVACVPRGSLCPGETPPTPPPGPGSSGQPPPAPPGSSGLELCGHPDDCPTGYTCNPFTNKCEPETQPRCDDFECALQGGNCVRDECIIIDECENVTCNPVCSGNALQYDGICDDLTGQCIYGSEFRCTAGCSVAGSRCKISVGKLIFIDIDKTTRPLRGIRVEAAWSDELGILLQELPARYSDADGTVQFSDDELEAYENGSLQVTVVFEDKTRRIQIVDASSLGATPTDAQRLALPVARYTTALPVDRFARNFDLNLTLTGATPAAKYARIYYHALEAIEFMQTLHVRQKSPPERFYVDDPGTTGAFHDGGSTVGAADKGIVYSAATSVFINPESPTNREWHEFGHHIMYELYGYHLCCVTSNHAGITNPTSVDSYTEGFAEFMSMLMLDHYNYPKKNLYFVGATPYDMEINYRVDSSVGGVAMEEMALASIYYDLFDGGPNDEDGVQLTRDQIWGVLSAQYNFGGGTRYIQSISDAYRAFNSAALPGLQERWGTGPIIISKLDRIFITHGVYADRDGNRVWTPGEDVGRTIAGGTVRPEGKADTIHFNRPIVPGSYIRFDVSDAHSGTRIPSYPIHVVVHVRGIEEGERVAYDYDFDTVPDENGEININLPPASYNTTMTFSLGGDENYERKSDAFTLTSSEFYEKLDPTIPTFATRTVSLTPKPKPLDLGALELQKFCICLPGFLFVLLGGAVLREGKVRRKPGTWAKNSLSNFQYNEK